MQSFPRVLDDTGVAHLKCTDCLKLDRELREASATAQTCPPLPPFPPAGPPANERQLNIYCSRQFY